MSREILAFGLFAALATAFAFAANWPALVPLEEPTIFALGLGVALAGMAGVMGSVMIYATLGRELWSFSRTVVRFSLTTALLGTATTWLSASLLALFQPQSSTADVVAAVGRLYCPLLIVLASIKLLWEIALLRHRFTRSMTQLKRSARLMTGVLANFFLARLAAGLLGGVALPLVLLLRLAPDETTLATVELAAFSGALFVACVVGELLERYLFFAAVAVPRMPGGLR